MNEKYENGLDNASNEELKKELEKRLESKMKNWGESLEKKFNNFENKVPKAISAFFDALCLTLVIVIGTWVVKKFGWIKQLLSWWNVGLVFILIFVASVFYRYLWKAKKKGGSV